RSPFARLAGRHSAAVATETSRRQNVRGDRRRDGPAGRNDQELAGTNVQDSAQGFGRYGSMNAMTCAEVEEQLDLLAADACDAPMRETLEGHLRDCPTCAAKFSQSKRLQGLLDL